MRGIRFKIGLVVIAFILLCGMTIFALSIGEVHISISQMFALIISPDSSTESFILNDTRLPRVIAAIVIGGALALSGALYQGIIGNPLVSPSILGVLSGASFGAAFAMLLGMSILGMEIMCFIFGIIAMCLSVALSFLFDRTLSILMLILGGIIVSSLFGAGVSVLKILADPYNTLPNIVFWLMGSLASIQTYPLLVASGIFVVGIVISLLLSRQIDILNLPSESAATLGVNVRKSRIIFILIATLLASSSVALGGLIGWIGLVIPHIARFIMGANHRFMLPFCAIFGALFLLICDTLARSLASVEIPIGIVTSIFGIPVFVVILYINKRRQI